MIMAVVKINNKFENLKIRNNCGNEADNCVYA